MRLTFRPTLQLGEYHGAKLNLKPGETVEVADAQADTLLVDFPLNFVKVQDVVAPPIDRQIKEPARRKRA